MKKRVYFTFFKIKTGQIVTYDGDEIKLVTIQKGKKRHKAYLLTFDNAQINLKCSEYELIKASII